MEISPFKCHHSSHLTLSKTEVEIIWDWNMPFDIRSTENYRYTMVELRFESFFFNLNIGKERVKIQMSLPYT